MFVFLLAKMDPYVAISPGVLAVINTDTFTHISDKHELSLFKHTPLMPGIVTGHRQHMNMK